MSVVPGRAAAVLLALWVPAGAAHSEVEADWEEVRSRHFIVLHRDDEAAAEALSRAAENHYLRICRDLGYAKRSDFWLWEDRARIYLYPTREAFIKETRSPKWAVGRADSRRREIATFKGQPGFLDTILPHELTHLIFRESLDFADVPLWLNEGVSQWEELATRASHLKLARRLAARGRLLGLNELTRLKAGDLGDERTAAVFYLQATSLVGFLIERHGSRRFHKFCRQLRDGKTMEDALRFTYGRALPTMEALERAWNDYLRERE